MNELLASVLHSYARLSLRERLLLGIAITVTLATILYIVVTGIWDAQAELHTRIAAKERQLEEVHRLRHEILRIRQQVDTDIVKTDTPKDFSLFSFLDGIGQKTLTREKVLALSPSSRTVGDNLVEQSVEMKLSGVSLKQLVSVLHQIRNARMPLSVARLQMKKQIKDPYNFDITVVVSSLSAA